MIKFQFQRDSIFGPPFRRSVWSVDRTAFAMLLCLFPPLGVAINDKGIALLSVVTLCVVVAVGWQALFSVVRKRQIGWDGIGTAIIFALIAGEAVPLWQIALAVTFGIVVGEQLFGGRGFNFLNPAVVALAFLTFSFTGTSFTEPTVWFGIATVPSFIFLIATRLISWRLVVGIGAGLVAVGLLLGQNFRPDILSSGFIFIIAFLACDPVSSASTNLGRWANGMLIGGLAWVFTPAGGIPIGPEALVPAVLLTSVFAPLIDTLVVMLNTFTRMRPDA